MAKQTKQDKQQAAKGGGGGRESAGPVIGGSIPAGYEETAEYAQELKNYFPGLARHYKENVVPAMQKRFNYKNVNQVPKLVKVVVNMGVGEAAKDGKQIELAAAELTAIAGQKPSITKARKSISSFKLREGQAVGCFVTLRNARMYEFLERFIKIAVPRIRDFRGLPTKSFDGRGNHSLGIREHLIFMELDFNKVQTVRGLNITTVTTAKTDEEAFELLKFMGFPFREK